MFPYRKTVNLTITIILPLKLTYFLDICTETYINSSKYIEYKIILFGNRKWNYISVSRYRDIYSNSFNINSRAYEVDHQPVKFTLGKILKNEAIPNLHYKKKVLTYTAISRSVTQTYAVVVKTKIKKI